jgi:uncharacterized protein (DUF362 family)
MLKPNLVNSNIQCATKVMAIKALAQLMKKAGKEVMIGEGSASCVNFNIIDNVTYRTKKREILDGMQQYVFDTLGYSELARILNIPLINLHSGDMVEVPLKNGFVSDSVKIHKSITEIDLLCSVPMMKTHQLAA